MNTQATIPSHPFRATDALAVFDTGPVGRAVAINGHGDRIGYR